MVTNETDRGMVSRLQLRDYVAVAAIGIAIAGPFMGWMSGWIWKIESRVQRIEDTRYTSEMASHMEDAVLARLRQSENQQTEFKVLLQTVLEAVRDMQSRPNN